MHSTKTLEIAHLTDFVTCNPKASQKIHVETDGRNKLVSDFFFFFSQLWPYTVMTFTVLEQTNTMQPT